MNPQGTQQTDRRHTCTTVQPPQSTQGDTAHDTCITHAKRSALTPTLNAASTLSLPHTSSSKYSVKHRSIRHHRAEHYALRHVRHPRRSRGRIVRLPRLPMPRTRNEPHKPHKTIATVPVPLNNPIPKGAVYTQARLPILARCCASSAHARQQKPQHAPQTSERHPSSPATPAPPATGTATSMNRCRPIPW